MKTIKKKIPISADIGIPYLPEPHRTIIKMRLYESKSDDEIAKEMMRSVGNIRVSIYRSLAKLRKLDEMLIKPNLTEKALKDIFNKWLNLPFAPCKRDHRA